MFMEFSVTKDLKFTTDCPSQNRNKRMPVLDTEMWIEDKEGRSIVRYGYYEKPMVPNRVISEDCAMSWDMKKAILVSEGLRRLLRCDKFTEWTLLTEHLQKFSWKMYNSNYTKDQVTFIVDRVIKKYEKMLDEDKKNIVPLHRDEQWKKDKREEKKSKKKDSWYEGENGEYEAPLFVPWTRDGELKEECKRIVDDLGLKIKVVGKNRKEGEKHFTKVINRCK